jgi:hypothetical protein
MGSLRGCTFRGRFGRARATALCGVGVVERAVFTSDSLLLWSEALRLRATNTMAAGTVQSGVRKTASLPSSLSKRCSDTVLCLKGNKIDGLVGVSYYRAMDDWHDQRELHRLTDPTLHT